MKNFSENKALAEVIPSLTGGKYSEPSFDSDFLELFVRGMFAKLDQDEAALEALIGQLHSEIQAMPEDQRSEH